MKNKFNNDSSIETYSPGFYINNLHTDYVTSLAYSEISSSFFSASYDGKLLMMKLDENTISQKDIIIHREFYALGTNNSSIYSIDCDYKGEIIVASIYENVLFI
jgi:WD40 repeat protein